MRKMKDSGIAWMGEIPENWEIRVLKRVVSEVKTGSTPEKVLEEYYEDNGFPWFTPADFKVSLYLKDSARALTELGKQQCRIFPENTVLMVGIGASIGKLGIALRACSCNQQINAILCKDISPVFLVYYFTILSDFIFRCGKFTTMPIINQEETKNIIVTFPSLIEQQRIADYLDSKCASIDHIIEKQRTVIEKLKAYKQSVTTEAVTKGLNSDAPVKDSGIEWIGDTPEEWGVLTLEQVFIEHKLKNKDNNENNVLSLSYGKIIPRNIETNMRLLPESFATYNIVEAGYIVLRLTDLQNDKRSLRTGLVRERGIITSAYLTLKLIQKANSNYFYYLLHAYDIQKILYNMGDGVRQNLKFLELGKLPILYPSENEQQQITDYLDQKCAEIDKLITAKESIIRKLTDYKQSLIYEAVTGKMEI